MKRKKLFEVIPAINHSYFIAADSETEVRNSIKEYRTQRVTIVDLHKTVYVVE